jgi:hypothetical protein
MSRGTGNLQAASVVGNDLLDDGEADASADFPGLFGAFRSVELLPDLFQLVGAHTDAFVLDRDTELAIL